MVGSVLNRLESITGKGGYMACSTQGGKGGGYQEVNLFDDDKAKADYENIPTQYSYYSHKS